MLLPALHTTNTSILSLLVCNLNGIEMVGPSKAIGRKRSGKISWMMISNVGRQREAVDKRRGRRRRGKDLLRNEEGVPVEPCDAPRAVTNRRTQLRGAQRRHVGKVKTQGATTQSNVNNRNKLRVVGGSSRRRRLKLPDVFLRPMMGKVKEAMFNGLSSIGAMDGPNLSLLDVFSGSGSIGVEALSRGVKHVTFVDISKECCDVSLENAVLCGFTTTSEEQIPVISDNIGEFTTTGGVTSTANPSESSIGHSSFLPSKAVRGDALDVLYNPTKYDLLKPYDIITMTPPYEEVTYGDLVQAVAETPLAKEADTIIALEYPVELGCFPHVMAGGTLIGLRNRRYGRTVLALYICRPSGRLESATPRPEEFVNF